MSSAEQRQARAAEYRRLAMAEMALVEASPLAQVRAKHQAAADRWGELAEMDERPSEVNPGARPQDE